MILIRFIFFKIFKIVFKALEKHSKTSPKCKHLFFVSELTFPKKKTLKFIHNLSYFDNKQINNRYSRI